MHKRIALKGVLKFTLKQLLISILFISFHFCFQNPTVAVLDAMFFFADLIIYAATSPD